MANSTDADKSVNVPQVNYQDNQNFDPDIQKMYKHYITGSSTPNDNEQGEIIGIDDVRAEISATVTAAGTHTADLIASLNISPTSTTPASTPNTSSPVQFAQESRCHAFYRIIGFPVVNSDQSLFYNPGLDVVKVLDTDGNPVARKITLEKKINIAQSVGTDFEKISAARETYVGSAAQVFSVPTSVEAGVLSLTSGTYGDKGSPNIRQFNAPFIKNQKNDPFDFKIEDQTYTSPGSLSATSTLVGGNLVKLSEFKDATGNTPNDQLGNGIFQGHKHIIIPFQVDPRIDFSLWANKSKTVSGLSKRIAVPFVPNASFLLAGSSSYADTPLLEKIITKRFSSFNNTIDSGQAGQDLIDFVQGFKHFQVQGFGSTLLSDIFKNSIYKLSEQRVFVKYLARINAMMNALVQSMKYIHAQQSLYYWLPQPSTDGPEGGSQVRDVPLNKAFAADTRLLTKYDLDILEKQIQVFLNGITSDTSQSNAIPDLAGTSRPSPKLTFDSDTSDAEGDVPTQNFETITGIRSKVLSRTGECLQTVEMIMGEFSGLGLCDIVAIVGSLWVMPKNTLLGFLDSDAFARAQQILPSGGSLPSNTTLPDGSTGSMIGTSGGMKEAMMSLAQYVTGFYQIMDAVFADYFGHNANTTTTQ